METILITGLDGSGKSTIFNALSMVQGGIGFNLIYLPTIDTESLKEDSKLKKTAEFVNQLNQLADEQQLPSLKAIAIFSAMLLFKKIHDYKTKPGIQIIFCERHPLIDTQVYAQFYAEKAGSGSQSLTSFSKMDEKFNEELEYLVQQIPENFAMDKKASIGWLATFIFKRFFVEKKLALSDLKELFGIGLPHKIYYLKAKADILVQRIANREIHEAHETIEVLAKLGLGYDRLLMDLGISYPNLIEIIDAGRLQDLDKFKVRLLQKYSNSPSGKP